MMITINGITYKLDDEVKVAVGQWKGTTGFLIGIVKVRDGNSLDSYDFYINTTVGRRVVNALYIEKVVKEEISDLYPKLFLALEQKDSYTLEYKGMRTGRSEREIRNHFSDPKADIIVTEINTIGDCDIILKKKWKELER